jgi:hypothetical protein
MSGEPSIFKAWESFYVIAGSSSAALTGLVFIVVTLAADRRRTPETPSTSEGTSIFTSPTVVHFCAAFFTSGIFAAPWHALVIPSLLLGVMGAFGVVYSINTAIRAHRLTTYQADRSDWIWFIILPFLAYLVACIAGFALALIPSTAAYALAGATMLLIFVGIHNAWDVVTYLATSSADK